VIPAGNGYHRIMAGREASPELRIEPARDPLEPELMARLSEGLLQCPDVAFAHLPQVLVHGQQSRPELTLFVWLEPGSVRSVRAALNLVSAAVARVMPRKRYLDVVILNSAPELLEAVEAAGCLVVERNPEERRRALEAARSRWEDAPEPIRSGPWWWPFS
jgi:hypothetical protein